MRSGIAAASVLLLVAALPLSGQVGGSGKTSRSEHRLDPAQNRHYQTAAASPEAMNFYSGTVVLDSHGEAWVSLPAWFEPQNRAFSYQLTAIGAPAPNLYIAQKISGNRFKIAGGRPAMEVSWQVTAVRQDTRVGDSSTPVEEEKRAAEAAIPRQPVASNPTALPSPVASNSTALTSPVAPNPTALTSADIAAIKDILERQFKGAFESRSMSEMRKVWPDMPRVARNDIANLFQYSDIQDIRMDLKCKPAVTGDNVLAYCSHTFSFSLGRKAQAPLQFSVVYRLRRAGGEWRLEESRRGLATTGFSD